MATKTAPSAANGAASRRAPEIELRDIHKWFGPVHANDSISFTFKSGRIYGILGENGAGKSTLMKILSGFQPADEGEILVDGEPVDYVGPEAAIANGIGMLQQDPLDVGAFTVLEDFIYGSNSGLRLGRRVAERKLSELCARFDFDIDPQTPIAHLSIAQRQQLQIIRLLALGVRTLILDEPTTGISAEQKETLFDALHHMAHDEGMTVLLVSHKLEDVLTLCDEVMVLRAGKLVGRRELPSTTVQLVNLMFGHELAPQTLERIDHTNAPIVLKLDGITLHGERFNIDDLSLEVRAGEIIGLAGLDGSGQEMLMRACVGLERTHGGHVTVNDADLTNHPYRDYMRQNVAFGAAGRIEEGLIAGLTLTEHTALVADTNRFIDWDNARKLTERHIDHYRVRGRPDNEIQELSGGNQQRMLMALLPEKPSLLVLEQPTRGLDVDSARWIWQQLLEKREQGAAVIFSSPELDEIVTYSDRILVCYAGQVREIPDAWETTIDELGHYIGGHFEGIPTHE